MAKSQFGFGSVWTSATRTVTHASNAVGNLASASEALSRNAELNAWVSVAQASMDLCEELGLMGEDKQQLTPQEAMTQTTNILTTLRGY